MACNHETDLEDEADMQQPIHIADGEAIPSDATIFLPHILNCQQGLNPLQELHSLR